MKSRKYAAELVGLLKVRGKKIATVESCTGGLMAAAITGVSGASEVFDYGLVTYADAAKTALAGVPEYLILAHGAVSIEVAASMAEGARKAAGAFMAISTTGIAGPSGGSSEKPVGMVCFGLSFIDLEGQPRTQAQVMQFGAASRDRVREMSVAHALRWAVETLKVQAA